jgi:A/G-specific adenine glycosylase
MELLSWFDRHRRDLPWRRTQDPYAILVSEVMLQQTRVETVVRYFTRFLARFPDVATLAASELDDVLASWAGLGYYRRARLLKRTAEALVAEYDGRFPRTANDLQRLPGIGPYTAGAIASIAFGERAPLVDGNVARVLCRFDRIAGDWRERAVSKQLWSRAAELVPATRPGDFNQALMELGATVCTPRNPRCGECPIAARCEARKADEVDSFPTPRKRREPIAVRLAACIVREGARIGVLRRAENQRMAGLYDVPAVELDAADDAAAALRREIAARFGIEISVPALVGRARHTITHHKIAIEIYTAHKAGGATRAEGNDGVSRACDIAARADSGALEFVTKRALAALGLSALGAKVLRRAT